MAQLIAAIAGRKRDDVALADDRGQETWSELDERINRVIDALRGAGVAPGSAIALMCGNRREYVEVMVAAMHAGLVVVPVNWHWTAAELAYVIDDSDAVALVVEHRFTDVAVEACADPATGRGTTRIVVGGPAPDGFVAYEDVLAAADPSEPADQSSGGPMFYTSGTTGFPKGVRSALTTTGLDLAIVDLMATAAMGMLGVPTDGVTLLEGPAYHSAQWALSIVPLLGAASTVVMRHRFDPAELLELIDRYRVTNIHLVPTQFIRLLKLPDDVRAAFDGSSLVTVLHGAAPCPVDVKRRMLEWWGPCVSEYYGGTEGGFLTLITGEEWRARPGRSGGA